LDRLGEQKKFLTPVDLETEAEALNRIYSQWVSRVVGRCLLTGPPQEMDPMGDNSIGYSLALAVAILWIIMLVVGWGHLAP
jgi:hypothetical protein